MQDLVEYALNKFKPTGDQLKALSSLNRFFSSDKRCFLLKGYAGTGKTFLTKCIADYLKEEKLNPVLMAPTGRASRILQTKTKHNSTTIHKGIYNLSEVDEIMTIKNGKEKYKFKYSLIHIESNIRNVYLIDEASMISDKYAEDDFFVFGSGRLLKDLIAHISPSNSGRRDQIIFIGDPAQLPPVTDNISGALSANYLQKTFEIDCCEYELTEVVRQQKQSGILVNATYIRTQLQTTKRNSFELNTSFSDTIKISPEEVVETFLKENQDLSLTKSIIINYSNKSALDYNLRVREKLFADKMQIEVGDVLMINQNNYNYDPILLNGMMVKVIEIGPIPELKSNMKSYDQNGEDCKVTHKFRRIRVLVPTDAGDKELSCLILENFLYSSNPSLDYAENIALYLDFKIRNPDLKPKTKEFADTLRKDQYFNSLRVKYGYAITCHKAQGGEWDSIIVNLDVSQSKLSDNFLRWTYTAITRASQKLYLFNVPKENQFSNLKYNHKLLEDVVENGALTNEIRYTLPSNFKEIMLRFGIENTDNFKLEKLIEVLAISGVEEATVLSVIHNNFQEIYVFEKEGKKAGLSFWYNGNNKFTKIQIAANHTTDQNFSNELKLKFEEQTNIQVVEMNKTAEPAAVEEEDLKANNLFDERHKVYQTLYNELNNILAKSEIIIESIEHKQYQEFYTMKRNNEFAVVLFYYDGLDRFTHAEPQIRKCNSNKLLVEINDAIIELKKR
jgi:tRNA A37 threonylcarbamoyladenosine biosynthesis protein TsaE